MHLYFCAGTLLLALQVKISLALECVQAPAGQYSYCYNLPVEARNPKCQDGKFPVLVWLNGITSFQAKPTLQKVSGRYRESV